MIRPALRVLLRVPQVLVFVLLRVFGMVVAFGGKMDSTAGVMLPMFGPAALLGVMEGVGLAALTVIVQAALYLHAAEREGRLSLVHQYFPDFR